LTSCAVAWRVGGEIHNENGSPKGDTTNPLRLYSFAFSAPRSKANKEAEQSRCETLALAQSCGLIEAFFQFQRPTPEGDTTNLHIFLPRFFKFRRPLREPFHDIF
jgi:hypothetical protein